MKKILLLLCGIVLLAGCGQVKNEGVSLEPIENPSEDVSNTTVPSVDTSSKLIYGTYIDKNNTYNGASLETFTLKNDGSVERLYCTTSSDCTNYIGTFSINGNSLYVYLTKYQEISGKWLDIKRDSDAPAEYDIISDKSFKNTKSTYTLDS